MLGEQLATALLWMGQLGNGSPACAREDDGHGRPADPRGRQEEPPVSLPAAIGLRRAQVAPGEQLAASYAAFWEEALTLNPLMATQLGDPRYNDRLPNMLSADYREQERDFNQRHLDAGTPASRSMREAVSAKTSAFASTNAPNITWTLVTIGDFAVQTVNAPNRI